MTDSTVKDGPEPGPDYPKLYGKVHGDNDLKIDAWPHFSNNLSL